MGTQSIEVSVLLEVIDAAYDRKSWHGPNLRSAVRRVSVEQALWRPAPGRHNIWELTVHAAYWKYAVRRRLLGEKRGSFAIKGNNWFPPPAKPDRMQWRAAVDLLHEEHRLLRAAIEGIAPSALRRISAGAKTTNLAIIHGAAAHDVYHAGQIQLIKKLMR